MAITEEKFAEAFKSSFMQPVIEHGQYFEVQTTAGNEFVPADVVGRTCATHVEALLNYLDGTPEDEEELVPIKEGWLARMSAPGFMDCTDWTAHESAEAARDYLYETYADDEQE